jgi:hypothetical protein
MSKVVLPTYTVALQLCIDGASGPANEDQLKANYHFIFAVASLFHLIPDRRPINPGNVLSASLTLPPLE